MSEHNPILDGFVMGEAMADHNGVVCYPAMLQNSEDKYVVKQILVPATDASMDALLLSGAYSSREDALAYYQDLAVEILQESRILTELSTLEGFAPYHSSQVAMREDGNGYMVSLVAPYRTSLQQILEEQVMTHQGILDLAMDLCTALASCRRAGYLYIDLKPSNIFYTENKEYRIGDLGFISLSSLRFASLQEKYKSIYTAPEIEDAMSQLNTTLDVYALGLILYQAYNGGHLPLDEDRLASPLLPPVYADYEMAEIILTACHPEASHRWQDPTQLGQALVQYMQRNGVSQDPIIPAPVATPELDVGEDFLPEEQFIDPQEWDDIPDLDIFQELEEQPLQEDGEDSDESLNEILAQADDLIAHVLPEPAVAPDPIEVPMPEPIQPEPEAEIEEDTPEQQAEESAPEEASEEVPEEAAEEEPEEAPAVAEEITAQEEAEPVSAEPETQPQAEDAPPFVAPVEPVVKEKLPHPKRKMILRVVLPLLLLALLAVGAYIGIRNYQQNNIRTVHRLTITGTADSITVLVNSDLDETQMKITCSDAYGNTQTSNVVNGTATFTGLMPQTRYTIRVSTTGNYKLAGKVTDTFTTASQTKVSDLIATIGPADGSVYLSFRVSGVECDQWILTWSAPGLEAESTTFAGHSCTVYDLQIGKTYTFTLTAGDDSNVVGQTQLTYTAQRIIRAESPVITDCGNGSLTVNWNCPAGVTVNQWTVTCRDEDGFQQTITTTECTATFQGMTHETACTVEIVADGMPQGISVSIEANPTRILAFSYNKEPNGSMVLYWDYAGNAPEGGWIVNWSCDGAPIQTLTAEDAMVQLPYIPGGTYMISLIAADGTPIFGHTCHITVDGADPFENYGITSDDLIFSMCAVPGEENWEWDKISQDDYKTSFSSGEHAGFIVYAMTPPDSVDAIISILFVLRDSTGELLDATSMDTQWGQMWDQNTAELTLPQMPHAVGAYTIEIYFDGLFVAEQSFQIQ